MAVFFDGWYTGDMLQFHTRICNGSGGSVNERAGFHIPGVDGPGSLRLFAGQLDPADPSHFTIAFEAEERKGTIDGWLRDGDVVLLQLRDKP